MKLDHVSFSQVSMYLRCPRAYYYRYVRGLKIPPKGSMVLGRSVHFSLETGLKEKKETAVDPPLDLFQDAFHDAWERNLEEYELIIWEEREEKVKDDGYRLIEKWHKLRLPEIEPKEVEVPIQIEFKNSSVKLLEVVDLIDRSGRIIDHKVRKKKVTGEVKTSLQLSLYLLGLSKLEGRKIERVRVAIESLIRKKEPEIYVEEAIRTWKHVEFALEIVSQVVKAIEADIFPASPGNRLCSPRWCGYWELCMGKLEREEDLP